MKKQSGIQTANELLSKVLATTQTKIFWKDRERRFLGVNRAFLNFYGFTSESELIGKTDEELGWHRDPDAEKAYMEDERRILETGESTTRVPGKCMVKGEERDIVASKSPLYENGEIVGLVGSFEDVTEELRREREIIKLNAVKSDFMARVSHDMRTPLTAIIGLSDLGMHENPDMKDNVYYSKIRDSAQYLLALMNDILDVQKMESGQAKADPVVLKLSDIMDKVETMVRPAAEKKRIRFNVLSDREADRYYAKQDERRVEQVLLNILNNAVKYTAIGGSITWKNRITEDNGKLYVTHVIADTGEGMSKAFMRHMYDTFSQEHNRLSRYESGTGLGLAIVKHAMDLMGGTIECESEVGKGTTFTLTIPHIKASREEIKAYRAERQKRSDDSEPAKLEGRRILVVDDAKMNAEIVMMMLESKGAVAEYARDGAVALEKAKTEHYDAILMDIRMPVMNGLESAAKIRTFDQQTPIIALSANAYRSDIRKSLEAGMNSHVTKPVDLEELTEVLKKYIR
jgi:PAS domain S-box-containing protein